MATYFGNQTESAEDWDSSSPIAAWYVNGYVCPGSGTQNIQELSSKCCLEGANPANIRLGVYNSSGTTLIAEGTGEVAVSGSSPTTWQGHMTQSAVKAAGGASPGQLVGGTTYLLVVANDQGGTYILYSRRSLAGGLSYYPTDYTSGMPASISQDGALDHEYCIRCGVSDAVVATIEQEGFRFRNDDGSESAATWKANQDTNITLAADTAFRLRFLLKATGNPDSINAQAEARVKPSGGAFGAWGKIN